MSIQADSPVSVHGASKKPSLWDRWRNPRIATVEPSELLRSPAVPDGCYSPRADSCMKGAPHAPMYMARVARWKGTPVGGAILEVRDRTSCVRLLHVDAAWRRRGIGRRLLRNLVRRARQQFVRSVYALATAGDAGFYALHGFRPVDKQAGLHGRQERCTPATSAGSDSKCEAQTLLRQLPTRLASVPYDGITVAV